MQVVYVFRVAFLQLVGNVHPQPAVHCQQAVRWVWVVQ